MHEKGILLNKAFLITLLSFFLLVNESTISWLLAIFVGSYDLSEGFSKAFKYFSIVGYLFSAAFRAIPYSILYLIAYKSKLTTRLPGKFSVWFALAGVVALHAYGYWDVQHSLYTPERTSSTAAIAFIFIPFHAIFYGAVAGIIGYLLGVSIKVFCRA